MKTQKKIKLLAAMAGVILLAGFYPLEAGAKEKFEKKFEKTVDLAKDGHVVVENISGDIEVKTWDRSQVKIDALKVSKASTLSRAEENAERVNIEVSKEGQILRIETRYPKTPFKSLSVSVHYHLTIPHGASARVKSVSGDITLEKIGGALEADAVSGDIVVMGAEKGVDCRTVSGDLELQGIAGDAYVKTVSGDITGEGIKGSVNAETVSGDIEMRDVSEAKVVEAKALSGSIVYQGRIHPSGRYALKSHSGEIEMVLPPDSAFSLEARTFSGEIESDFEITVSGKLSKKEIHGEVNGGGAVVKLSTFSGDVELRKK